MFAKAIGAAVRNAATLVLVIAAPADALAQSATDIWTDTTITKLIAARTHRDTLIARIKVYPNRYDISASGLIYLYKNNTPFNVLRAVMMARGDSAIARPVAQDTMTNDDVMAMVSAFLPRQTTLDKIRTAPQRFDLSESGRAALKKKNVPLEVVTAMSTAAKDGPIALASIADTTATVVAGPATWRDSLEVKLREAITLANLSADRLRVTKPGTVLEVTHDGISAGPSRDSFIIWNTVSDSGIQQQSGVFVSLLGKKANRDLKVGEKVYAWDFDIKDDAVGILLITLETNPIDVKGTTEHTRYKSAVRIPFKAGTLRTATIDEIKTRLGEVLQLPAAAAEPKVVDIGLTIAQVEGILGKPDSIFRAGARTIYTYKSIKITFVDGKVSDIQ